MIQNGGQCPVAGHLAARHVVAEAVLELPWVLIAPQVYRPVLPDPQEQRAMATVSQDFPACFPGEAKYSYELSIQTITNCRACVRFCSFAQADIITTIIQS